MGHVQEADERQHVRARVHERKEEGAAQVEARQRRVILDEPGEQRRGPLDNRRLEGEQQLHELAQSLGGRQDLREEGVAPW